MNEVRVCTTLAVEREYEMIEMKGLSRKARTWFARKESFRWNALDERVPPGNTYRMADALIQAGKEFEFMVYPSLGHSPGGDYGIQQMFDFFERHLRDGS